MRAHLLLALAVLGAACVVAGIYQLFGAGWALVAGGLIAVTTGLLADDGRKPKAP